MTPAERIAAAQARNRARETAEREAAQKALKSEQAKLRKLTAALGTLPKGKP